MKRAGLSLILLLSACGTPAQTANDIVARYLEARGGLDRLRGVRSLRMRGRLVLPGIEAPLVLELKRPASMRTELTVDGHTGIRAYDGRTAWMLPPIPGAAPRVMPSDQATEARAQADVDLSPLVDSAAKGFTVELAGRATLPGGETWTLIVRGGEGSPRTLYVDPSTHHVVRTEDVRILEGREVAFVTEVGDYRAVDGLVYPHLLRSGPRDDPEAWQRLEIDTIEINPALDDDRFAAPGDR